MFDSVCQSVFFFTVISSDRESNQLEDVKGEGFTNIRHQQRGAVRLQYVPTDQQVVDILTKALGRAKFIYFREHMSIEENTFLAKRECRFLGFGSSRQVF